MPHQHSLTPYIDPRLAEGIPDSLLQIDLEFREDREMFEFHEIIDVDILEIMGSISSDRYTGVDGVPIRILEMCSDTVCSILRYISNHKIVNSNSLSKFFKPLKVTARRNTRCSKGKNMMVPNMETSKGRSSITYRGPNHCNSLSNHLKIAEKFCAFKRGYSKELSLIACIT